MKIRCREQPPVEAIELFENVRQSSDIFFLVELSDWLNASYAT